MRLLYTHPNALIVLNAKNIIELSCIKVELRNEFSLAAVGELPPVDNWLELWVVEDMHYQRALDLLASFNEEKKEDWQCIQCLEMNGDAFEYCWNCQTVS
ncbi:MAG: hypothetical protein ACI9ES_000946 [Oceanospirillaceae bacterium]